MPLPRLAKNLVDNFSNVLNITDANGQEFRGKAKDSHGFIAVRGVCIRQCADTIDHIREGTHIRFSLSQS